MATKKRRPPGLLTNLPPHAKTPAKTPTKTPTKSTPGSRVSAPSAPRPADLARATTTPAVTAPPANALAIAQRALDIVESLRGEIGANFHKIGRALRDLRKPVHYRALGHTSFDQLLQKRRLMSRMQAGKLVTVVNALPERIARKYGVERAYKIVRYAEARHPRLTAVQVLENNPLVRTADGILVHLTDIRLEDLAAVLSGPPTDERKEEKQRAISAARSLGQLLPHAGIDPDRVRTIRRRSGAHAVRIELTPEEANELAELIGKRAKSARELPPRTKR